MQKLLAPVIVLFMLALPSATAFAQEWVVSKVSGKAWVESAGAPSQPLSTGMTVPQGSTITTAQNGRATLVHGRDAVAVGPKSVLSVQAGRGAQTTTILQRVGQITVDVETQHTPHFTVETPFMAAVVKGTMFDVRVSARGANVNVQRGRVQVADFATGQTADITPGQRASVRAGGSGLSLSGKGRMPSIQSGVPRAAVIAPMTRANLDQGSTAGPAATTGRTSEADSAGFGPGRSWSGSTAIANTSTRPRQESAQSARGMASNRAGNSSNARNTQSQSSVWSNQGFIGNGREHAGGLANARGVANAAIANGNKGANASKSGNGNGNAGGNGNGNAGGNGNGNAGGNGNGNAGGNGNGNAGGNGNGSSLAAVGTATPGGATAPGGSGNPGGQGNPSDTGNPGGGPSKPVGPADPGNPGGGKGKLGR